MSSQGLQDVILVSFGEPPIPQTYEKPTVFIGFHYVNQVPSGTTLDEFWTPKAPPNRPNGLQDEPKGPPRSPQDTPNGAQRCPWVPKVSRKVPTVNPRASKVSAKAPKVSPRTPKVTSWNLPRHPKGNKTIRFETLVHQYANKATIQPAAWPSNKPPATQPAILEGAGGRGEALRYIYIYSPPPRRREQGVMQIPGFPCCTY
jgi:hypothetical protein